MTGVYGQKSQNEGRRSLIWFIGFLAMMTLTGCAELRTEPVVSVPAKETSTSTTITSVGQRTSPSITIDADVFADPVMVQKQMALSQTSRPKTICPQYVGGVVNHHTLAPDILASFFTELARCRSNVRTIIMISPDHYQAGQAPFVTHMTPYRAGDEEIFIAASSVDRLRKMAPFGRMDHRPFLREHGIGALVPFLHQVFPQAMVVPVVVDGRITYDQGIRIRDWLKRELQDLDTLVVVSSDMSHYLTEEEAQRNDKRTMEAFAKHDAGFFFRVSDDYTDNGKGIWMVLEALPSTSWHVQSHKSSSQYGGSVLDTTTYINGFWSKTSGNQN